MDRKGEGRIPYNITEYLVQSGSGWAPSSSYADMIEFVRLCTQTGFDVPHTFAVGQLGKRHAAIVIRTSKCLDPAVAVVASNTTIEDRPRQMIHDLRKNELAVNIVLHSPCCRLNRFGALIDRQDALKSRTPLKQCLYK